MTAKLVVEMCTLGFFNMPGLTVVSCDPDLRKEINQWMQQCRCGTELNERYYSFRTEKQREWFLLRWASNNEETKINN